MSESINKETEKKRVKRSIKIFLGALVIIFTLIYVTSLQNWDVKPIVVKSVTWADAYSFDMVMENPNDFEISGTVSIDANNGFGDGRGNTIRNIRIVIPRGESVVRVGNFNIDTSTKRQGNMVITAIYLSRTQSGKEDNRELLRKVVDLPYVDVVIQSSTSSMVLTDEKQYLTLTNIGNVPERFMVDARLSQYETVKPLDGFSVFLKPNEPIILPLRASYSSQWTESGTSIIEVKTVSIYGDSVNDGKVVASTQISWTAK